ncbi:VENN motif pre-toxin domain-containing protein, partial [Stenotrophomonas maltophilia]
GNRMSTKGWPVQSNKATQAYYDGLSTEQKKAFNALSAEQRDAVLTANSPAYENAKKWGTGGDYNRALNAVTTALVGGVAGQGAGQVASNALAPYAAYFIGSTLDPNHGSDPNATLQLLSHAVLGALLAEANGGNAGTGAVSAAGGELAAKVLTNTLTGGDPSRLSQEQKEMVLALSQAVGALAGGLSGQDLAGIALNAGIAKNSVENNFLAEDQARVMKQQLDECGSDTSCQKMVRDVAKQLSERMDYELLSVCTANSASPACQAFVNAAVSYKYGSWPGELGLFDDLGRSSEALSSFAHSMNGRAYRELIFENGGIQPVYILPQEHTVAALTEWTGNIDRTIDQYGLFSKESSAELGLGLAKVLFRKYGIVNMVGGNGGFGSGASGNAADYQKLKDALVAEDLRAIGARDPRLNIAVGGSGTSNPNFSVGRGTHAEAERMGKIWVGDGARRTSDGTGWISADGTRVYRPPSEKLSELAVTGVQANFERYEINKITGARKKIGNGHMDIDK